MTPATPQHGLAARDVGARVGDDCAGRDGAAQIDRRRRRLDQLGVLDHHDGVGAARDHPAGRDHCRRARDDRRATAHARRRCTSALSAGVSARFVGADGIGGAHREAVDVRAIERRHVDGAATSCASTRPSARPSETLSAAAAQDRDVAQTGPCLLGGDDFEELLLPCGAADGLDEVVARSALVLHSDRSWPRSYHGLASGWQTFAVGGDDLIQLSVPASGAPSGQ